MLARRLNGVYVLNTTPEAETTPLCLPRCVTESSLVLARLQPPRAPASMKGSTAPLQAPVIPDSGQTHHDNRLPQMLVLLSWLCSLGLGPPALLSAARLPHRLLRCLLRRRQLLP